MRCLSNCIWWVVTACAAILTAREVQPLEDRLLGRASIYKTEPLLQAAKFKINQRTEDLSLLSPGLFFLTVQTFKKGIHTFGPQIFDNNGELVFANPPNSSIGTQEPSVCDYDGVRGTHMCVSNVDSVVQGTWKTSKAIYKNDYTLVKEPVGAVGDFPAPDGHEFQMVDNGRAYLQPVYQDRVTDLRSYGAEKDGVISDACFQEISVDTGRENMAWCYMDHFNIASTYIYPNTTKQAVNLTSHLAGAGSKEKPWDAFHINSMDKNDQGNYVISIRHTNQVIVIAGRQNAGDFEPGHVLWQLGGKSSDYEQQGFNFSRQHHVRFVKTEPQATTLSIFDNAWEGDNDPSSPYSSGKVIEVDHESRVARLVKEFKHPEGLLAMAAGSFQFSPEGNAVVGWGWKPYVTEYDPDGRVLLDASFEQIEGGFSYRTRKYPWVGQPRWRPKLLAYQQSCSSKDDPLMAYVSWNGATEVRSWSFYISFTDQHGPWIPAGTFQRTGFETEAKLSGSKLAKHLPFARLVSVEALDRNDQVIGEAMASTFVPKQDQRGHKCNEKSCAHFYEYPHEDSVAEQCRAQDWLITARAVISLLIAFAAIECLSFLLRSLAYRWTHSSLQEDFAMSEKANV